MNFNKIMPNWANKGNEPSEDLKANGFKAGNKPPANIFNWFFSLITDGIKEVQEKLSGEETARINADKEFELRTTAYPVVTFEKNTASGYGVLHVTIPDISSYEDLIDKPIYIDTEDKYLDTDLTMYIQINDYANMTIRKCVPRQAMNSAQYKAYEITTNMIMQLAFYKHFSGKYYCYWVNSIAGEVATDTICGRVKLSDSASDTSNASTSIAATPYLVSLKADKQTNDGGFEGGGNSNATDGGAVGYYANATSGGAVGGGATETSGGGAVGHYASTTTGGAVGYSANATSGGAVGNGAKETEGGFAGGNGANATSGGAVGNSAKATSGGAVGNSAKATSGGAVGNGAKETSGGGAVGSNANAAGGGGAVGSNANATGGGGAVGDSANAKYGGGAIGYKASAESGGAVGNSANATSGGAVGDGASATNGGAIGVGSRATSGGAVGAGAETGIGFAGGQNARTISYNESGNETYINAIQLGTGTNSNEKTLQVYDKQLMNADGIIPLTRLPIGVGDEQTFTLSAYRDSVLHSFSYGCVAAFVEVTECLNGTTEEAIITQCSVNKGKIWFMKPQGVTSAVTLNIKYKVVEIIDPDFNGVQLA